MSELRERGVDETFLAPAECVQASVGPAEDAPETQGVRFVLRQEATTGDSDTTSAPRRDVHSGGDQSRQWSLDEMHHEYGIGCKLFMAMGYEGGGMVPLAAVKRHAQVALQDDEALALDRSFPLTGALEKKKKKQRIKGATPGQKSQVPAASAVEAAWAAAVCVGTGLGLGSDSGVGEQVNNSREGEVASEGETGESDDGSEGGSLRRALLMSLRRGGGRQTLSALAARPRIRRSS